MQDIAILGAGGLAREVAFLIEDINKASPQWRILGFVQAGKDNVGTPIGKYAMFCSEEELLAVGKRIASAIAIGNPRTVQKVAARFTDHPSVIFPTLVHPSTIWDRDRIERGNGNMICAGNASPIQRKVNELKKPQQREDMKMKLYHM